MPHELIKSYKTLDDIDVEGKTVLLRADVDVPYTPNGEVADDNRLKSFATSTLTELLGKDARVIIIGHKGRPKGHVRSEMSLLPVARRLEEILESPIKFCVESSGRQVDAALRELPLGQAMLLENLRFNPGEERNNEEFAQQLAELADIYINDAFATSHRRHASIVGIPKFAKESCIGRALQKEIETLGKILQAPEKPFTIIVGGAKVSTKLGAMKNLVQKADQLMVGGAMANTFLAAMGKRVGKSIFEMDYIDIAREIMILAGTVGCRIILPKDVVVAHTVAQGALSRVCYIDDVAPDEMILDVGPETLEIWQMLLGRAGTLLWNGPLGLAETPPYDQATRAIAETLQDVEGFSVVGGGDTLSILKNLNIPHTSLGYVSTAGGALLEYLEGKELVGLSAIKDS